jgi:hypothetical protein
MEVKIVFVSCKNSALIEILSGLEETTGPTHPWDPQKQRHSQARRGGTAPATPHPQPKPNEHDKLQQHLPVIASSSSSSFHSNLTSTQKSKRNSSSVGHPPGLVYQSRSSTSAETLAPKAGQYFMYQQQNQQQVKMTRNPPLPPTPNPSSPAFISYVLQQNQGQAPKVNLIRTSKSAAGSNQRSSAGGLHSESGNISSSTSMTSLQSNNMVTVNINNNVDLGISPSSAPLVNNISGGGSIMNSSIASASSNSKAKLKEALSQKNLLRLNFEQAPSNCDSTVLLSSSSPSLSSNSSSKKSASSINNPSSQLKL